jgi:hypothetical protein
VPLPPVEMNDISSADGTGLVLAQVIRQVLTKMLATALTEGKGIIPTDTMQEISGNLSGLASGVPGETKGILEKTTGAIKGLFGK